MESCKELPGLSVPIWVTRPTLMIGSLVSLYRPIFYCTNNESNSGYSCVEMCYSSEMTKVSSGEDSWPFDKG